MCGENERKEINPGDERFMLKTPRKSFLEKYGQTPISKKENELLDRDFGHKNIDELVNDFNNTKTNE